MKQLLISFAIVFSLTNPLKSQWTLQFSSDTYLKDVLFLDENTGFVTSPDETFTPWLGGFYMTTNGGTNWIVLDSLAERTVCLSLAGNKLRCFSRGYTFIETTNAGQTWAHRYHPLEFPACTFFLNENTGWIGSNGGKNGMYKTTDGGSNWNYQGTGSPGFSNVESIYFLDESTGVAAENVFAVGPDYGQIIRTTNGGSNWSIVYEGDFYDRYLWNICYNRSTFYAVNAKHESSSFNKVLMSTDSGNNWLPSESNVLSSFVNLLWTINFFEGENGFISGTELSSFRTLDGGSNWINMENPVGVNARDAYFINDNTGWIIGNMGTTSNGRIFKTTTGGLNFASVPQPVYPPSNIAWDTIRFKWSNSFYTTSYNLQISTDTAFISPIDTNFIENNNLLINNLQHNITYYWRVKANGVIGNSGWSIKKSFRIITSSIESVNNLVPDSFNLFQNYPNPFNPVTRLKFSVPISTIVRIKVYDITGKEIQELINEYVQAGNFETVFDGGNLSSGIYYYSMEAGDFRSTRKMLLIK